MNVLRWVRFVDQPPPPDHPHWAICFRLGEDPQFYHWFIDREGLTEENDFFYLSGYRLPPLPLPNSLTRNADRQVK